MHVTPICRLIAHSGCQYDQLLKPMQATSSVGQITGYPDPNYPDSRLTELRK